MTTEYYRTEKFSVRTFVRGEGRLLLRCDVRWEEMQEDRLACFAMYK